MTASDTASLLPRTGPYGLGGLLWLLALPLLLLPLPIVSLTLASPWTLPSWTWPSGVHSPILIVVHEYGLLLVLLCSAIAAEAFFRRSRRFPTMAMLLLLAWCLLSALDTLALRPEPFDLRKLLDAVQEDLATWLFALLVMLYLRRSRRVRNTFGVPAREPSHSGPASWLLDGPDDWNGGVWLIVGGLAWTMLLHATQIPELIESSIPPAIAPDRLHDASSAPPGSAGAMIASILTAELAYVPFARALLLQHALGAVLALWAAFLFVRRSRRTGWAYAGSVLLVATASLTGLAAGDDCLRAIVCHDAAPADPAFGMLNAFWLVSIAALALPAVRRRGR